VLSDDRIVSLLTADGVNIARRTVAKYREAMRIPSSVERRRQKQSELSGRGERMIVMIDSAGAATYGPPPFSKWRAGKAASDRAVGN
jgi:hypothetical protein